MINKLLHGCLVCTILFTRCERLSRSRSRTLFNHGKNSSGYILQTIAQTKLQIQKNIYIYVTLENLLSMSAVGTKVYVI